MSLDHIFLIGILAPFVLGIAGVIICELDVRRQEKRSKETIRKISNEIKKQKEAWDEILKAVRKRNGVER